MTSTQRRVVITGVGVICPLGIGKDALWDALAEGRSGVAPLRSVPTESFPMHFGAEARAFEGKIDDFAPLDKEQTKAIRKQIKVMCRECQMGVAAAQHAMRDAGLVPGSFDPRRTGISFGSDYMLTLPEEFLEGVRQCLNERGEFEFSRWATEGLPKLAPLWLLKYLPNMPASHLAIFNDLQGPNNSITLREASANVAVGEAFQIILRGSADAIVAGATGTRIHPMKMVHATQQEELADGRFEPHRASRPFDRDRCGMVLGEGAGAVVLEELAHAQARGAALHGEVVAAASSSAAGRHLIAHRDRALENVLRSLLSAAGLRPDDVGHVHAHGLSTRTCDVDEARAIRAVFGGRSKPVRVTAAKSYFGNLGAGSGMVELAASLLAMARGRLFRVLNYETPDPECPLEVVCEDGVPPGDQFVNVNVTPQGQASGVVVRSVQ